MLTPILALGALSSLPPAASAPGGDWLDLDAEIATLAADVAGPGVPAEIGGRLLVGYFISRDPYLMTGSTEHASGVDLRSARLHLRGSDGGWAWRVSGELADGSMELVDAWLEREIHTTTHFTLGRFKRPVLQAGMVDSEYRLFWDRGNNGAQTVDRELGLKLGGDYGQFHAIVSAMNDVDGLRDEAFLSARVEYDLLGEPFDRYEGAYGAAEGIHLGLAGAAAENGALDNGLYTAYELELTAGGFFLGADLMFFDPSYDMTGGFSNDVDLNSILGTSMADTHPLTVTTALLFGGSRYELAGRVEVFDDEDETSRTSVSFSLYDEVLGPRSRILIDYADVTSDDPTFKGDKVEIGYVFVVAD
ncbi:MAG: hypothetical protein AB1726_14970 [Planctomycetota bacterium]